MFKEIWILTLIWFVDCEHVEGEQKNEPIIAAPGRDVLLPCRLDSENRKTMTKVMLETFIQRVSLNPDGLKRGDVTLKIRNVTLQDEGMYRCYIHELDHRETVHLVVEPNGVRAPTMETSQFNISTPDPGGREKNNIMSSYMILGLCIGLVVFVLSILSAFIYICQRRRQKKPPSMKTFYLSKADMCILKIEECFSSCSHTEALHSRTATDVREEEEGALWEV
ncbi:uncharacterized protein LOC112139928 isoform X2 [Oryzias melastigma]|uniref:uncharacterized protein LOC112139928 isoform X2 n=1 Tax=Oryzias melastigma TaxID=30732 RepID=UPI00168D8BBC|nr:uncharacterized protein LOC112139928 isoform X2 [Oryzias melastigma]